MAQVITDGTFDELAGSGQLVVVDFWAEWCGPCKMLGPIVEELATTYEGKAIIGKLDVDENPDTCEKYGIRNIPTVLFIKNGEVVDKLVGAVPKATLAEKIDALL